MSKARERKHVRRPVVAAAVFAGTLLRVTRPARRTALRVAPGVLGVASLAAGLGELASHVFGRGLAPWVALAIVGLILVWDVWNANRPPRQQRDDG